MGCSRKRKIDLLKIWPTRTVEDPKNLRVSFSNDEYRIYDDEDAQP
jgi:hypothetical protein